MGKFKMSKAEIDSLSFEEEETKTFERLNHKRKFDDEAGMKRKKIAKPKVERKTHAQRADELSRDPSG